jgi:hypothetical protein
VIRAGVASLALITILAKPKGPAPPPPSLAPLPMLPSVARVKVTAHPSVTVIIEEVNLPRGDWKGEALDLHVAFGAPGPPRALDVHLVPVEDGALEPDDETVGEAVPFDRVPRRPPTAHPLLGRDALAGIVLHLRPEAMKKALAPGNMANLRIRTAVDSADADGVVVRLGASRGTPLTLGRITVAAAEKAPAITRAEARLCGPDADQHPLAVSPRPPRTTADAGANEPPVAPVLAVRHATDDLCLRFWR